MFPTDVDLSSINITSVDDTSETTEINIGRSIQFDYESQRFIFKDGKNVEPSKIDSIKQWIELYIRTEIDQSKVYSSEFGVDLRDLVSYRLPRGYQVSEIIRRITEGILSQCPNVVSVSDWNFDKGHFSFTATTNTGEEVTISE